MMLTFEWNQFIENNNAFMIALFDVETYLIDEYNEYCMQISIFNIYHDIYFNNERISLIEYVSRILKNTKPTIKAFNDTKLSLYLILNIEQIDKILFEIYLAEQLNLLMLLPNNYPEIKEMLKN